LDHPKRDRVLAKIIRRDADDPWIQLAVQSSLHDSAVGVFVELMQDQGFRSSGASRFLTRLAQQINQQEKPTGLDRAVLAMASMNPVDGVFALPIMGTLRQDRWQTDRTQTPESHLQKLDQVISKMVDRSILHAMQQNAEVAERVNAIETLAFGKFLEVRTPLSDLIDQQQPLEIQRAAIATLGRFDESDVAEVLLDAWQKLSPSLRDAASEVVFARDDRTMTLFDRIDEGRMPLSDLSPARLKLMAQSKNDQVAQRAVGFLESLDLGARSDVVANYQSSLNLTGDVDRGRDVFKKSCAACHKVEGVGYELGPNLATIKTRGVATILVNVLDPSREVNPEFLNYAVLTHDGKLVTGMIVAESANSITLRRGAEEVDTILRSEIEALRSTGVSIMPEGLEKTIDPQGMADLIAYLMRVK
ncbi:MAG: c-type cytochrome, partial [Pirellulaceae bacterium]|nr:c-type cytochrome [Pirellulaceae bacterium]